MESRLDLIMPALGIWRKGKHWGPCPACHRTSSRKDKRPTLVVGARGGWRCVVCGAKGDVVTLVALVTEHTEKPRGESYVRVLRKLEELLHGLPPDPPPEEPPQRIDPTTALRSAVPLSDVNDPALAAWLELRHISRAAPAGWLPNFTAPWWTKGWPVIIPACSGTGAILSIHGIAIGPAKHKTRWPTGADAKELLFASAATRAWLAGQGDSPREVIVVEGATDFLTASTVLDDAVILGITSGGARALSLVPKQGIRWYAATDPDRTGRRYAHEVADALYPYPVRQLPLPAG